MTVLSIAFLIVGIFLLSATIIVVWRASDSEKDSKLVIITLLCLVLGIFFVGASGYCDGLGNPKTIIGEQLPLPENEIFLVKAIEEDDKNVSLLVVPFADQNRTRIYYIVPIEKIAENISVDYKIVNDGEVIRKI